MNFSKMTSDTMYSIIDMHKNVSITVDNPNIEIDIILNELFNKCIVVDFTFTISHPNVIQFKDLNELMDNKDNLYSIVNNTYGIIFYLPSLQNGIRNRLLFHKMLNELIVRIYSSPTKMILVDHTKYNVLLNPKSASNIGKFFSIYSSYKFHFIKDNVVDYDFLVYHGDLELSNINILTELKLKVKDMDAI